MQLFQYEPFIISHVSKEVLRYIQLTVTYADKHKDTYDLWTLLNKVR